MSLVRPFTLTPEIIRSRLAQTPPGGEINPFPASILSASPRPAAVLVPLLQKPDGWHLLYIRRTRVQRDVHSGQVAFPGGSSDPGERNPRQTALREANEEIGLPIHRTDVLGCLPRFRIISNYIVTPVVAHIPWPFEMHLSRGEVSRVFTIPLHWLAEPANREVRRRVLVDGRTIPVVYFRPYDGEVVWGATARITVTFLQQVGLTSGLTF